MDEKGQHQSTWTAVLRFLMTKLRVDGFVKVPIQVILGYVEIRTDVQSYVSALICNTNDNIDTYIYITCTSIEIVKKQ